MNVIEVLEAARARVEKGWTQGVFARGIFGVPVASDGFFAMKWCSGGAVHGDPETCGRAIEFLSEAMDGEPVTFWNDAPGRTQAQVLAAFDKAILLARSAQ